MSVSRETILASVSRETQLRLQEFVGLLGRWNTKINLVASSKEPEIWSRHIADSLRLIPLLPANTASVVDLGSGAGFPGLVVAIATGIHVDLIESDRRKAAFLLEAARLSHAPITVHAIRIETRPCKPAHVVIGRALASLPRLLELAYPMLTPDGVCLFHKGRNAELELAAARKDWMMSAELHTDDDDPSSVILRLSQIRHA